MKELHNHIFSKTTCISKETMLKYINKQLPDKEVHDVQKHLIDCEFCSEALEGMQYAENSSVLFSIDHKIDSMVSGKKTPVIKNLMIAATIIVLAFGTYFSFLTFNDVVSNSESNISMNTVPTTEEKDKLSKIVPIFEDTTIEGEEVEKSRIQPVEEIIVMEESEVVTVIKEEVLDRRNNVMEPQVLEDESPGFIEQDNFAANAEVMDFEEEIEEAETAVDEIVMESKFKELEKTETVSVVGNVQSRSDINEISKAKKSAYNKRDKKKAEAPAPVMQEELLSKDKNYSGYAVGGVVNETNLENTVTESSDASTMDFDDVSDELYKSYVSNGITLYEANEYEKALAQFELSLKENETENNESLWYKALCLIELNRTEEAKTTLKKINDDDYFIKATNKLKEL